MNRRIWSGHARGIPTAVVKLGSEARSPKLAPSSAVVAERGGKDWIRRPPRQAAAALRSPSRSCSSAGSIRAARSAVMPGVSLQKLFHLVALEIDDLERTFDPGFPADSDFYSRFESTLQG